MNPIRLLAESAKREPVALGVGAALGVACLLKKGRNEKKTETVPEMVVAREVGGAIERLLKCLFAGERTDLESELAVGFIEMRVADGEFDLLFSDGKATVTCRQLGLEPEALLTLDSACAEVVRGGPCLEESRSCHQ